ncbi:MAG: magnesium and cobalt transport protein CorA [Piccolia ochrophora]|nr:MAG: magnesium and cobalt transport protein CorA [Piccolia ochrophora]
MPSPTQSNGQEPGRNPSNPSNPTTATGVRGPNAAAGSQTGATTDQSGSQARVTTGAAQRRRRNKFSKKKRRRRQSFAIPSEAEDNNVPQGRSESTSNLLNDPNARRPSLYRLGQSGGNLSNESLDSEALLDHRDQESLRPRRQSLVGQSSFGLRPGQVGRSGSERSQDYSYGQRRPYMRPVPETQHLSGRHARPVRAHTSSGGESDGEGGMPNDTTPLIATSNRDQQNTSRGLWQRRGSEERRASRSQATSTSSRRRKRVDPGSYLSTSPAEFDVNNPPSIPPSPKLGPDMGYGDVMVSGEYGMSRSPERRGGSPSYGDSLIDIDNGYPSKGIDSQPSPSARRNEATEQRRRTIALPAEEDVCFPIDGISEIGDDELAQLQEEQGRRTRRRRRVREWPDLSVLDEWSREEKEQRSEGTGAKKINEPVLVGGRLRPNKAGWHRQEEDAPYRFTYFNEEFQSTIHSQTISELIQPGQSFRELFIPDPPPLSDDETEDEEEETSSQHEASVEGNQRVPGPGTAADSHTENHKSSLLGDQRSEQRNSSGEATPSHHGHPNANKQYGTRPTFWLDVLSPTDAEMRIIAKTFGIHPLTAEDIMMQEAREKVELFRNYYFVNYRTFEQDVTSEDYLDPVNMYVVVFREGVISFHFSMIPHPANVRRRIRQLKDYLILSADWISYAVIDDITDGFAPLIQSLEDQVDNIEDAILGLQSSDISASSADRKNTKDNEKRSEVEDPMAGDAGADMLRRVGECRKRVMGMLRLLGNKADVIKGFAKRCTEQWEIAPRSEIGLYLGDIQDHIVTMTSNLTHYEQILSRSHSNYLAQINIRMNERQEQTADTLGRLTVLGTIVLPMNIITGLWGMNCLVPGQDVDSLNWFWGCGCPPNPALGKSITVDFSSGASDMFTSQGNPTFDSNGASFTVAKAGDSPLITSNFYIMFGKVDVSLKAAPGKGIVSSVVLQSDALDEIDWEWLGADPSQVQSNYFGKGQTGTYNRGAFHPNADNQASFKTYSIDWSADQIVWSIDGDPVRAEPAQAAQGQYPQTPMQIKLGAWSGGDSSNAPDTVKWAGGPTDYSGAPYAMQVKSIAITDYSTGTQYTYNGGDGTWQSINAVGGKVNPSGGSGSAAAVVEAPSVMSPSPAMPVPFEGTHRNTDTGGTAPTTYPGLPEGWSVKSDGKLIPGSAPTAAPAPPSSFSGPDSPGPVSGAGGGEVVVGFNEQGFPTTYTNAPGATAAPKRFDDQGFPIPPSGTPQDTSQQNDGAADSQSQNLQFKNVDEAGAPSRDGALTLVVLASMLTGIILL